MDSIKAAALSRVDGIPIVAVAGEVDISNRAALEDTIASAADDASGAVVVSLERATYFDSAIIHVIMRSRSRMRTSGKALVIVRPAFPAGRRVLEIAGLLDASTSFDTVDAALDAAKAMRVEGD